MRTPHARTVTVPQTTLTLAEAAWLLQVPEDTLYRRCRRGRVAYAYQVGDTWHLPVSALRRGLPRLAAELAQVLAAGEIELVRPASRFGPPTPLSVYQWIGDTGFQSNPCPQGDVEASVHESDSIAHLRTLAEKADAVRTLS